jgi:hypothetical protein
VVFCAACSSNGSSFVALSTNTGIDPATNPAIWHLIAQAGGTGATGSLGSTGATGATGATGPAGGITSVSAGTITTGGAASLTVANGTSTPSISITVPSIYGDGSNSTTSGICSIAANTNWTNVTGTVVGNVSATPVNNDVQCTTFSISSGVTLYVPSGTVIRATGMVTISGTIVVEPGGAQGLAAFQASQASVSGSAALPPSVLQKLSNPGLFGGGNGAMESADGTAGYGGGSLVILAGGSISISGSIDANGSAGADESFNGGNASGGGAGGIIILASKVSIVNTGTLSAVGGAGGPANASNDHDNGGGGGGGLIHLFSPSNTPGSTALTGGAAGTTSGFLGDGTGLGGGAMGGNGGSPAISSNATAGSSGLVFTTTVADPATLFVR